MGVRQYLIPGTSPQEPLPGRHVLPVLGKEALQASPPLQRRSRQLAGTVNDLLHVDVLNNSVTGASADETNQKVVVVQDP